jgi:ubiquinone/menaquinone biosynthesis C-methylase UbiE
MTLYEFARNAVDPLMPPLHRRVKKMLIAAVGISGSKKVLDVGGRKSTYTISVPAKITVLDLPRTTELQNALNLGATDHMVDDLRRRRSNIEEYKLGDMTNSSLPSESFDISVSVEVLEHVDRDDLFVSEVSRILKPGGLFIMTTPNGDYLENRNPDHKRHYRRRELERLLGKYFTEVRVEYAIVGGYFRKIGLRSWSARHPIRTASTIFGNIVNSIQSSRSGLKNQAVGTHHLIATARRALNGRQTLKVTSCVE